LIIRHVLKYIKKQSQEYRSNFGEQIQLNKLGDRMSSYFNGLSMSGDARPLAVSLILGAT
jgi:20S proteasome alpha/beta subunit